MPKVIKNGFSCLTELNWEEKNPTTYLFNNSSYIKLQKTIEKVKNGGIEVEKGSRRKTKKT